MTIDRMSRRPALGVAAVIGFALAAARCQARDHQPVEEIQSALTTEYALPVAVGLSPNDVALGADGVVSVNDGALLLAGAGADNSLVALGTSGTTSIGVNARVGKVWSAPNLLLRRSFVAYFKTAGTASIQAGTTIFDPDEDRTSVPIRRDPIWTVTLTAPDSGVPINVSNLQVRSISPGNHGPTTVFSGGRLVLTSGGNYRFVSLDLEPGATVQITDPANTSIFVNSSLILRAPLGGTGLIFAYLGSAAAFVQAPFTGDLFLAKNADVNIFASSTGHFFAKNITLFEGYTVGSPRLSNRSQAFLRPTERVQPAPSFGEIDPGVIAGEISTAVIPRSLTTTCPSTTAFLTWSPTNVIFRPLDTLGSTSAATPAVLPVPGPPPACVGAPVPGWDYNPYDGGLDPEPDPPMWTVLPGGRPFYTDQSGLTPNVGLLTDNLMTRLSGGRVVHGATLPGYCLDPTPPQGAGCPATAPAPSSACNLDTQQKACFYGASQCVCSTTCLAGGAACKSSDTCCGGACGTNGKCPTPPGGNAGTWLCGPVNLNRFERGADVFHMSTNCGTTWTSGTFDPFTVGILGQQPPQRAIGMDRPEMYYDPFDDKLYASNRMLVSPNGEGDTMGVVSASTAGLTNAANLSWQVVKQPDPPEPWDSSAPQVVTTVLDEQAVLPGGGQGRWVFVVRMRCNRNTRQPLLDFLTPSGWTESWDLAANGPTPQDPTAKCDRLDHTIGVPSAAMPFFVLHEGPSIVGISATPPRVRVAFTGLDPVTNRELINVVSVTLRSANGYMARPTIVRELTISGGENYLWPQLISPDNLAGSNLRVDMPVVLRYAVRNVGNRNTVHEVARVIYSGLSGPEVSIRDWTISGVANGCTSTECSAGDYRYGSFIEKVGSRLSFFTPWAGQSTTGTPGIHGLGAVLDVTP